MTAPVVPAAWPACLPRLIRIAGALAFLSAAGCTDPAFGVAESRQTTAVERVAELRHELRRDPADTGVLNEMGKIYADQGLWSESMGAYREALIVTPGDRGMLLGYGRGQLAQGDYAGALRTAQQAGGGDVAVLLLRSGALTGLGRLTEARAVLETAQRMNPRDLDVRSNIALVAALQNDPAAYSIARAVAFAPDSTFSHIRNLVLIGGITGNDAHARDDGERRGLDASEIGDLLAVGRRARIQGMQAITVLTR